MALVVCATGFVVATGVAAHGAAISRDKEREADASARERLAAAGYCAGPAMQATFAQLARAFPSAGGIGLFSTHPGYRERWEGAGLDCGPGYVVASGTYGLGDADTAAESTAALFDGERPRQPSWRLVGSDGLRFWRKETCLEAKRKLEKYKSGVAV